MLLSPLRALHHPIPSYNPVCVHTHTHTSLPSFFFFPSRLLAYAGFDPRRAVTFWENRHDTVETAECTRAKAEKKEEYDSKSLIRKLVGPSHPLNVVRVDKLKEELARWETERYKAIRKRAQGMDRKHPKEGDDGPMVTSDEVDAGAGAAGAEAVSVEGESA